MESRQRKEELTTDRRTRYEKPVEERPEPKFHVYIRLPFKRGDFVDPGPVSPRTVRLRMLRQQC
jgi:hypothetical protein